MNITVIGAGAFGSALASVWSHAGCNVTLYGRDTQRMAKMAETCQVAALPNATLPAEINFTAETNVALRSEVIALAIPAQTLRAFLSEHAQSLGGKSLIACCKGIDITTLQGPLTNIQQFAPDATAAMLTGPSFAADIAAGLPTALTLACGDETQGIALQALLSTQTLRLYRTTDTRGAELGGALKNVLAIACGIAMGAGLGDSARAALLARGFSEMTTLGARLDAKPETLAGLSGLGDLVLTCTSIQSRNFQHGFALGAGKAIDRHATVEGVATAKSVVALSKSLALELPICSTVAALVAADIDTTQALETLMQRPLKEE